MGAMKRLYTDRLLGIVRTEPKTTEPKPKPPRKAEPRKPAGGETMMFRFGEEG